MRRRPVRLLLIVSLAITWLGWSTSPAQAGPLLDWLRGRRAVTYRPVITAYDAPLVYAPALGGQPTTAYYPGFSQPQYNYRGYTPDPASSGAAMANTQPTWNGQIVARPVMPQQAVVQPQAVITARPVIVNYPQIPAFQTRYVQIPVTYYRPETMMDPVTGAAVTVMRPCTAYQVQVRRVPVRTFRPLFPRLFNRTPPAVTYVMPDGGACTTTVPATMPAAQPYYTPPGTSVPGSSYPTTPGTPTPSLNPDEVPGSILNNGLGSVRNPAARPQDAAANRPAAAQSNRHSEQPRLRPVPRPSTLDPRDPQSAPQLLNPRDRAASVPVHWAVAPISWPSPVHPVADQAPPQRQWDDSGWKSIRN